MFRSLPSAVTRWLGMSLGLALAAESCPPHAGATPTVARLTAQSWTLSPRPPTDARRLRRLRGDWQAPSTLLIAYEPGWEPTLGRIAAAARDDTDVVVVVRRDDREAARWWLGGLGLESLVLEHDTGWIRDYGPFEIIDETGRRRWLDMGYALDRMMDDALPQALGNLAGIPVERHHLLLDGGGLISNGRGLCAMTQTSYLRFDSPAAPTLPGTTLEQLGCQWLTVVPTLTEEETGHIDMVAQFLTPHVVAVAEVDPAQRPEDATILDETASLLQTGADQLGQRLEVVRVPLVVQGTTYYSYINGTRLRHRFLAPAYLGVAESLEQLAYERLRKGLPRDVELFPLLFDDLAALGGAVHCVTLGVGTELLASGTHTTTR